MRAVEGRREEMEKRTPLLGVLVVGWSQSWGGSWGSLPADIDEPTKQRVFSDGHSG